MKFFEKFKQQGAKAVMVRGPTPYWIGEFPPPEIHGGNRVPSPWLANHSVIRTCLLAMCVGCQVGLRTASFLLPSLSHGDEFLDKI
jgi:hypothetical protein